MLLFISYASYVKEKDTHFCVYKFYHIKLSSKLVNQFFKSILADANRFLRTSRRVVDLTLSEVVKFK